MLSVTKKKKLKNYLDNIIKKVCILIKIFRTEKTMSKHLLSLFFVSCSLALSAPHVSVYFVIYLDHVCCIRNCQTKKRADWCGHIDIFMVVLIYKLAKVAI